MTYTQITIEPRDPSNPLSGSNCRILFDGKPIGGVTKLELTVAAGEAAIVKLELVAPVRVLGQFSPAQISTEQK